MKLHRFFLPFQPADKWLVSDDANLASQLKNVLRFQPGDTVILVHEGFEAKATIRQLAKAEARFEISSVAKTQNEPAQKVALYCAILKKENFELVCQKATEAGIAKIIPVISARTVKLNLNEERLKKIIREAAEQSGRGVIPILNAPIKLEEALTTETAQKIFFDASGESFKNIPLTEKTAIFIGPEGGWDEKELELAEQNNCSIASLGTLTLRAETAAIVASYLSTHHDKK